MFAIPSTWPAKAEMAGHNTSVQLFTIMRARARALSLARSTHISMASSKNASRSSMSLSPSMGSSSVPYAKVTSTAANQAKAPRPPSVFKNSLAASSESPSHNPSAIKPTPTKRVIASSPCSSSRSLMPGAHSTCASKRERAVRAGVATPTKISPPSSAPVTSATASPASTTPSTLIVTVQPPWNPFKPPHPSSAESPLRLPRTPVNSRTTARLEVKPDSPPSKSASTNQPSRAVNSSWRR